jgi:hypothetical protein
MKFAIKKSMNGDFTRTEYNDVINMAQRSYQSYLIGQLQQYQYGHPQARVQYSQNEVAYQKITPLIYSGYALTIDANGNSSYPDNYCITDSMLTSTGNSRIRPCMQKQLYSTLDSSIDPVATNPIYLIENNRFQFYPITQATAKLNYIRNCPDIVWGYTLDSNGREVYNQASSTDPVWDDIDMMEIIVRALSLVGCNLQLNVVSQYANDIKKGGE